MDIRYPSVAGLFYPGDAAKLRHDIKDFMDAAGALAGNPPKAIVAPHAGYIYSGQVAGYSYAAIHELSRRVTRVLVFAPAHRYPFRGMAVPSQDAFSTPLGEIPLDDPGIETALTHPQVSRLDRAFDGEHAIEVQLPFLQQSLEEFSLVPILVGATSEDAVAEVMNLLWGGGETLIVISSDLSHYLSYEQAKSQDGVTRQHIEHLHSESLTGNHACGYLPLRGLLRVARERELEVRTLDMRNSGDTAGPRNQVVGYGAYAFYAHDPDL
ncbi:MAG: AmmeMemoRadiSam system protein B [Pseudomonadota bacterium]